MIPANIDYRAIVLELQSFGITSYKLELICGYADGYITHLMAGNYRDMTYQRAARLYNFWCDERISRGLNVYTSLVSLFPVAEKNQALAATT